jgi:hypothetical protein
MDVRWGKIVSDPAQAERAAAEGFDFVQPAGEPSGEETGGPNRRRISNRTGRPLPSEVCAVPLPADVRVTEKGFNLYVWIEHVKSLIPRLAGLGCRKLIWSDGRARVLPVEGETAILKEQVMQFLYLLCDLAGHFGMKVLVEPLGPRRTNFLNSMQEVSEFLPRVGRENLSSMISLRELEPIGLSLPDLAGYARWIEHVQLENPQALTGERVCPRPGNGYDYRPFMIALKGIGYRGGISLPGDADAAGLAYCRGLWEG